MIFRKIAVAGILAVAGAAPAWADIGVRIGIDVPLPPPAPVYEVAPGPVAGYVWAPGYWAWNVNRYIWIRGRYLLQRPGYAWAPEHWEHRGNRYHFVSGDWRHVQHVQQVRHVRHVRHVRQERHERRETHGRR